MSHLESSPVGLDPSSSTLPPVGISTSTPGAAPVLADGYRDSDYRNADNRDADFDDGIDWVAALRRYWYVLLTPIAIGAAVAFGLFQHAPNVYRSSSKLLIESDAPSLLDSASGDVVSSLPSAELLLAQLMSDDVLAQAAQHLSVVRDANQPGGTESSYAAELAASLEFQSETGRSGGSGAMVFYLHVDHQDPAFTSAGVNALSLALEEYFSDRREDSIDELKSLIKHAKDKLLPELDQLEAEYEAFRDTESNLAWDPSGELVNRFREKERLLVSQRAQLETQKTDLDIQLAAIANTVARHRTDPVAVLEVVGHLVNTDLADLDVPGQSLLADATLEIPDDPIEKDLRLQRLNIERSLVPLEVERDQYMATYGELHPRVQNLNQRIDSTRAKLQQLIEDEDARRAELSLASFEQARVDPDAVQAERQDQAKFVVNSYVRGLRARQAVLLSQLEKMDEQIEGSRILAAELADAERQDAMFKRKIDRSQGLLSQVEEQMARVNLADQGAKIRVKSLQAPDAPRLVSPRLTKSLGIGTFLGALLGCGLIYVLENSSHTYRNSAEVASSLDVPVLGQIPRMATVLPKQAKQSGYAWKDIDASVSVVHNPAAVTSEAVRRIRTSLFFEAARRGARVIQVTSPIPEDGKSTVSANLAASIAISGKTVVLVDADLRRPQTSRNFGLSGVRGVTELLNDECEPTDIVHATAVEKLSVVPTGAVPGNPAEALALPEFAELLAWLRKRFDYVIVDTPPLLVVSDPAIVANVVDGVVFAFRVRRGCRPQTKEALAMLRSSEATVLGCIVNKVNERSGSQYKASSASSYHYRKYEGSHRSADGGEVYEVRSSGKQRGWMERD